MRLLLHRLTLQSGVVIRAGQILPAHWRKGYGTSNMDRNVRIGCASGFWGDTPTAAGQLIRRGKLDFLVLDYLSEVTMSLLVASQQKNPELGGWCPDFVQSVGPLLPEVKKQGVKIVTNAGGVNPSACMKTLLSVAEKVGCTDLKIALVTGDDLLHKRDSLTKEQCPSRETVTSANAYLGAGPISRALDLGADIVITGRCTDSALALGPLIHTYQWSPMDYDLMAKGSLAGHLIECGAQATGGIYTDWDSVEGWENNGFPIAICSSDGGITITKPEGTGGLLTRGTVGEQLLYEIGNPTAYILPDVVCDFSNVELHQDGENGVRVSGAKGRAPTPFYKVGGTFQEGWKCTAVCPIIGPRAREKGRKTAEAILKRSSGLYKMLKLPDFKRTYVQILGSEEAYGDNARAENLSTRDAVLWMSVHHSEKKALEIWAKEIASAGTGMAPGLTTVVSGRPKPAPLLHFFSYLFPKQELPIKVKMSDGHEEDWVDPTANNKEYTKMEDLEEKATTKKTKDNSSSSGTHSYKLSELAWLRSGDKGDTCNIGVIARNPEWLPFIEERLGGEEVIKYFRHKFDGNDPLCKRYKLQGVGGLNFVLEKSLGGGGIAALNPDPQGKGYAQMLADFVIKDVPKLK